MIQMAPTPTSRLDPNSTLSAATDLSEGTKPPWGGMRERERERERGITADSGNTLHKLIILCAHPTPRSSWDMALPTSQAGKIRIQNYLLPKIPNNTKTSHHSDLYGEAEVLEVYYYH